MLRKASPSQPPLLLRLADAGAAIAVLVAVAGIFFDQSGRIPRPLPTGQPTNLLARPSPSSSDEWEKLVVVIQLPPGTDSMSLSIQLRYSAWKDPDQGLLDHLFAPPSPYLPLRVPHRYNATLSILSIMYHYKPKQQGQISVRATIFQRRGVNDTVSCGFFVKGRQNLVNTDTNSTEFAKTATAICEYNVQHGPRGPK